MTAKLIIKAQMAALIENGRKSQEAQRRGQNFDPMPAVKLFTPDAQATWLLTEVDPDTPDIAFALCRARRYVDWSVLAPVNFFNRDRGTQHN